MTQSRKKADSKATKATPEVEPAESIEVHVEFVKTEAEGEEKMSEKQPFWKWDGLNVGMEMFNQFAKPWSEAVQSQMEQVRQLQTKVMERTQEAMQETHNLAMEGFQQMTNTMQKVHETAQEQLKRFMNR